MLNHFLGFHRQNINHYGIVVLQNLLQGRDWKVTNNITNITSGAVFSSFIRWQLTVSAGHVHISSNGRLQRTRKTNWHI